MHRRFMALVAATFLALAMIGAPGLAEHRASPNSQATITVEDCVVESSKDISYIAYFSDGDFVEKDEDVDAESFDLTGVEGIDDVDAIEVKSGTTVETFSIDCVTGDSAGDDVDDGDGDGTDEDVDDDERARGNSAAVITLGDDCVLESSKDISYVAFFSGGQFVEKIEDVDAESFDLTSHEGIEDIDAVEVKSGTTVEEFAVDCPAGDTAGGDADEGDDEEGTEDDDTTEPDDGDETDEPDEGDGAVITLSGCVVESTKDISYVAYFSNGEFVEKDESMNSETFDLNAVEGIEDIDSIEVKSSTTVETFAIDCGTDDTTTADTTSEDSDEESTEEPADDATDEPAEEPEAEPDDEPADEEPTEDESTEESDDDSTEEPAEDDDSEDDTDDDDVEESDSTDDAAEEPDDDADEEGDED